MIGFRFCFLGSVPPSLPAHLPDHLDVLHLCLIVSTSTHLFIGPPSPPFCVRSSGLCTVVLLCVFCAVSSVCSLLGTNLVSFDENQKDGHHMLLAKNKSKQN